MNLPPPDKKPLHPHRQQLTRRAWMPLAAASLMAAAQGCDVGKPNAGKRKVLVDSVHATNFLDDGLKPDEYDYHHVTGLRRAFEFLAAQGVQREEMTSGRLTPQRLAGAGMLFINLVSAERPPFLVSEIQAVKQYLEQGGSLFLITDHSNCYYHAHRLQPLLTTLGIRSYVDTACDVPPHVLGQGNGWVVVTDFDTHPVTQGLTCIAQQTGGVVDSRYAVARTSESSWADAWKPGAYLEDVSPGLFGDFNRSDDEEGGPLGVVLARETGLGRIVIVADQNMLGDVFLHYADNYRLWQNACAYLLRDAKLAEPDAYHQMHQPRIFMHEDYTASNWGETSTLGYHSAWASLNRNYWAFAGDVAVTAQQSPAPDLLIFAHNRHELKPPQVAAVGQHLTRGGNLLILTAEENLATQRSGIIGAVRTAMDLDELKATRTRHTHQVVAGNGALHIYASTHSFQNFTTAGPAVQPSDEQQKRMQLLNEVVASAMPT